MITAGEQKLIAKVEKDWSRFKLLRNKKRYEFDTGDGWLSMLKREEFLDFTLKMLQKCKKEISIYE